MATKNRKAGRIAKKKKVSGDSYIGLDGYVHKKPKPKKEKYMGLDGQVHIRLIF
jgi:hypothetical protein